MASAWVPASLAFAMSVRLVTVGFMLWVMWKVRLFVSTLAVSSVPRNSSKNKRFTLSRSLIMTEVCCFCFTAAQSLGVVQSASLLAVSHRLDSQSDIWRYINRNVGQTMLALLLILFAILGFNSLLLVMFEHTRSVFQRTPELRVSQSTVNRVYSVMILIFVIQVFIFTSVLRPSDGNGKVKQTSAVLVSVDLTLYVGTYLVILERFFRGMLRVAQNIHSDEQGCNEQSKRMKVELLSNVVRVLVCAALTLFTSLLTGLVWLSVLSGCEGCFFGAFVLATLDFPLKCFCLMANFKRGEHYYLRLFSALHSRILHFLLDTEM